MKPIKLNSLSLFLLLLAVLVIFMLFNDWFLNESFSQKKLQRDGFIDFKKDVGLLESVILPQYDNKTNSSNIAKLYDNLYFDTDTGHLIEIIEVPVSPVSGNTIASSSSPTPQSTLSSIVVISNDGHQQTYMTQYNNGSVVPYSTPESKNILNVNTFSSYTYITKCVRTDQYMVVYCNWKGSITITIINLTKKSLVGDYIGAFYHIYAIPATDTNPINFRYNNEISNRSSTINQLVTLEKYGNAQIYQISDNFYFDQANGNLILKNPTDNTIQIYNRTGTKKNAYSPSDSLTNTITSWKIMDEYGNKLAKYIATGMDTLILLLSPTSNGSSIGVYNMKIFDQNGLVRSSSSSGDSGHRPSSDSGHRPSSDSENIMSDYYKWSMFWGKQGQGSSSSGSTTTGSGFSDDYILKTQIVPPVCPACPSCAVSTGTCTNCGGQGGSGTLNNAGTSIAQQDPNTAANLAYATGSGATRLVRDAATGATHLVRDTAAGATDLAKDVGAAALLTTGAVALGAYGVGKEVASGAYGVGKEVVGGAYGVGKDVVGAGKDVVSGAYGVGKDVVGGVYGVGKDVIGGTIGALTSTSPTQVNSWGTGPATQTGGYNNSYGGPGQPGMQAPSPNTSNQGQNSVTDPYSYYGALSSKKSNFVPVTADFSRFGR